MEKALVEKFQSCRKVAVIVHGSTKPFAIYGRIVELTETTVLIEADDNRLHAVTYDGIIRIEERSQTREVHA